MNVPAVPMGSLAWQKQLASESSQLIGRGLDLDVSSPSQAVQYYRRGAQVIRQALSMQYASHETAAAKPLEEKMRRNLALVEDRLRKLEQKREAETHMSAVFAPTYASSPEPNLLPHSANPYAAASSASSSRPSGSAFVVTSVPTQFVPPKASVVMPAAAAAAAVAPPCQAPRQQAGRLPVGGRGQPVKQAASRAATGNNVRYQASGSNHTGGGTGVRGASRQQGRGGETVQQGGARGAGGGGGVTAQEHPLMRGIDKEMQKVILREIVDDKPAVRWEDVAGLKEAKACLREMVILPALRPDLFSGIRSPPRGLLLFGPPGNGKTLLAKAVAKESKCTFFSISASSLISKYMGESEKLVRALFAIARVLQPSIVFIDEIDSMLGERGSDSHPAMRRLQTEFLVQIDGVTSGDEDYVLVLGATNRPQDLDEAARRRLGKRLYIPLPCVEARTAIIAHLLAGQRHSLTKRDMARVAGELEGYSGADLTMLCKDAALQPIRELGGRIMDVQAASIRPISLADIRRSAGTVRPSVDPSTLDELLEWNKKFGSSGL